MAIFKRLPLFAVLVRLCLAQLLLHAQPPGARFDLVGPRIEVRVTRAGKTLPIASVPNLQPGDKLWLHPDLPPTQSVKYLLIVAFLRGTTNPPPDHWFTRIDTWKREVREEGVFVTVPDEAQQALLFLAPETGGDFTTLRSAVKGRPGVFVRASQDLAEAGFEQSRIERYLAAMKQVPPSDPKALLEHSTLLARTLNLKPNEECFKRAVELQYTCLTQTGTQSLLDDGHGQTLVAALSQGPGSDLIQQASYTSALGAGVYSAYVGAIVDLFRLTASLYTAQYQYIPAIAFPQDADLKLRLNAAPSFHNPKSVIVIGLPAVQAAVPPPLRPADPKFVTCLLKPAVVLPVDGAPLVFSTAFAHDLILHIRGSDAQTDLPLIPDPFQGGLVLAPAPARKILPDDPAASPSMKTIPQAPLPALLPGSTDITGVVSGFWGFDAFTGPTLHLQNTPGRDWKIVPANPAEQHLIIGRENHLELASTGTACVDTITADGTENQVKWKPADKPDRLDLTLALKSADPGALHLAVKQFGDPAPATVAAETFSEPARLTGLQIYAGDTFATLSGVSLAQVKQVNLGTLSLAPVPTDSGSGALKLSLPSGAPVPKLKPGETLTATILLKDNRTLSLPVTVAPPRPAVTLLARNITLGRSPIQLANHEDLPVDQQITFSLRSEAIFPRTGQIEVANADESLHTALTVAAGTLVLQNPHTLLATLDPLKSFGTSSFGPLRLRPIAPDGVAGDWLPLATLVRLPTLSSLRCPGDPKAPCLLSGTALYLLDSIAPDATFTTPVTVPEGFVGTSLAIPHPTGDTFFLRLRDDPNVSNPVTLPAVIDKGAAEPSAPR